MALIKEGRDKADRVVVTAIYKDRGFGMFDLGDGQIAACNPTREDDFICGAPFAATGVTVFFCNTVGF